jgi:hypothetical protein
MKNDFNLADVPTVAASDISSILGLLVDSRRGLALLRGLTEQEIREIEDWIWQEFPAGGNARLAIALRFRAVLDVFGSRRLKALFLERGYRLFEALAVQAASRPLNARFGFNPQRLLLALDAMTDTSARPVEVREADFRIAA